MAAPYAYPNQAVSLHEKCKKKKMTLISYICNLHGDDAFVLCRPMSLCFLEGPEGGIGIAFGKKPKKVRGEF